MNRKSFSDNQQKPISHSHCPTYTVQELAIKMGRKSQQSTTTSGKTASNNAIPADVATKLNEESVVMGLVSGKRTGRTSLTNDTAKTVRYLN